MLVEGYAEAKGNVGIYDPEFHTLRDTNELFGE
jgi:hypothetical protein